MRFARQQRLLDRVKELAAQQVSIIMSSDDLKHIFAVTDRILVLYQGRQIALRYTSETTPREIVELIVGSNRQERVTPVIWAFENYHYAQQQAEQLRQAQLELQQSLEEKDSLNRQLIERLGNQVEALNRLNLALQESGRRAMDETVENHLTRLYRRLDVQSRLEAVNYVMQHPEILGVPGRQTALRSSLPRRTDQPSQFALLLVDDSDRYRAQLQRMIGRAYPQAMIYEADTVEGAVRLADSLKPLLIFVDVILGNEDGIHCTRRLKALSPNSRVVLISAYPDREFHRLGLEAGATAFLDKKALDVAAVQHIIEDILG